jgi:hypothetical protein
MKKRTKQLKLTLCAGVWKGETTQEELEPPHLCAHNMRSLFEIPLGVRTIYATISSKAPTSKHLQDAYLEFRYDEDGFLDIRHPWKSADWAFTATLSELDHYVQRRVKQGRKYFAWFEHD